EIRDCGRRTRQLGVSGRARSRLRCRHRSQVAYATPHGVALVTRHLDLQPPVLAVARGTRSAEAEEIVRVVLTEDVIDGVFELAPAHQRIWIGEAPGSNRHEIEAAARGNAIH